MKKKKSLRRYNDVFTTGLADKTGIIYNFLKYSERCKQSIKDKRYETSTIIIKVHMHKTTLFVFSQTFEIFNHKPNNKNNNNLDFILRASSFNISIAS